MTKVKLFRKPLLDGSERLFLDFYPPIIHPDTGKLTRREYLELHLHGEVQYEKKDYTNKKGKPAIKLIPKTNNAGETKKVKLSALQKNHNEETLALAENIRARRQIEIQNGRYGFLSEGSHNTNFLDYFEKLWLKKEGKMKGVWGCALHYLKEFTGGNILFKDVDVSFCNDINKDQQSIQRLEAGKMNPTYFYLLEVAKGLEMELPELLDF